MLEQCGWTVQDYRAMKHHRGSWGGRARVSADHGEADYMLYADSRAIGIVEAKPKGHTLSGIETQSDKYVRGLPPNLPHCRLPLPFAYESTGSVTRFRNGLDADDRSREVFAFHRPEELIRLVGLDAQVRAGLRCMPGLNTERLWRVQIEAIQNLERSLAPSRTTSHRASRSSQTT